MQLTGATELVLEHHHFVTSLQADSDHLKKLKCPGVHALLVSLKPMRRTSQTTNQITSEICNIFLNIQFRDLELEEMRAG